MSNGREKDRETTVDKHSPFLLLLLAFPAGAAAALVAAAAAEGHPTED